MKATEIIRIIAIVVIGAGMMFFAQPWLYQSQNIFLGDVDPDQWVGEAYFPASAIVFVVTSVATLAWYGLSLKASPQRSRDTSTWRTLWWILLLPPVASICVALFICRDSSEALISLTLMYIVDVLLIYWVATASSSPGHTKHLPPGSFALRHIFEPR